MITIKKIFIFGSLFFIFTLNSYAININQKSDLLGKCFTSIEYQNNEIKYKTTICFKTSSITSYNKAFVRLPNGNTLIDAGVDTFGNWHIKKNIIYINNIENKELGNCQIQYKNKNIFFQKCTEQINFLNKNKWSLDNGEM